MFGVCSLHFLSWWDLGVFFSNPPKIFLSKMERKQERKYLDKKLSYANVLGTVHSLLSFSFFPCFLFRFVIFFFAVFLYYYYYYYFYLDQIIILVLTFCTHGQFSSYILGAVDFSLLFSPCN